MNAITIANDYIQASGLKHPLRYSWQLNSENSVTVISGERLNIARDTYAEQSTEIAVIARKINNAMTTKKENVKIGIISAMPSEIAGIIAEIASPKQTVISSIVFIEGYIDEKNVVVAYSGIGKVNAAIVTTLLCTHFEPRLLIMTGIAGSLHDELAIGDVVIATTLFNTEKLSYQSDSDNLKNPVNHQKTPLIFLPKVVNHAIDTISKDFKITYGSIATSDDFPTRKDILELAIDHKADIIDMEAAAFAQVCWAFNRAYLVIKSVSNSALDEIYLYKKDSAQNLVIQEKSLIDDTGMARAIYHAEYVTLATIKAY